MQKQQVEMTSCRKKCEGRMNDKLKKREEEHQQVLQSYENSKKQIESQQTIERNKLEQHYKTRPGTAQGRSVMGSQASKMGASRMGRSTASRRK